MATRRLKVATLDEAVLKKLQQMEESLGTLILALEPHYPLAQLSEDQISKLKTLEEELGVVLIAYQS